MYTVILLMVFICFCFHLLCRNDKQAVKTWEVVPDPFRTAKQKKKMNIVFHAILAPHFGYQEDVNRIFMRFGGPFGDWNENLVQLHPVR